MVQRIPNVGAIPGPPPKDPLKPRRGRPNRPREKLSLAQKKLLAIANSGDAILLEKYKPTDVALALAGTLFHSEADSLDELAEESGITYEDMLGIAMDPTAVLWVTQKAVQQAKLGISQVYARIYTMALKSPNSAWAELYLRRFDPEYRMAGQRALGEQNNTQINIFSSWSEAELANFIRSKSQQVLGKAVKRPAEVMVAAEAIASQEGLDGPAQGSLEETPSPDA